MKREKAFGTCLAAVAAAIAFGAFGCERDRRTDSTTSETQVTAAGNTASVAASVNEELERRRAEKALVDRHIDTFDDLDFNVFSKQRWDQMAKSHAKDIIVHWPDGHTTTGLERHIEDLKQLFTYAPDTRIPVHPVKFGAGEWTSVLGEMEGTFTKPMRKPDGKVTQPTNKAFKLTMNTVGKWKDGVMIEEYLFWDNAEFMKQIGLAP